MIDNNELITQIKSYNRFLNIDTVNKAYNFALEAHQNQKRDEGVPYIIHPVAVAKILTDLKLDSATITTGLLHDTIEDTNVTYESVKKEFGEEVANLVDGVTKISALENQASEDSKAENFRKLILATSKDIRVLLVKLADRLHNMRTIQFVKDSEKKIRKAKETMEIYAPLAERMGMNTIRDELEDLSFSVLNKPARDLIIQRLQFIKNNKDDTFKSISTDLIELLNKNGVEATITGREKTPFSIWRKIQNKKVSLEQLTDIIGFRIIVKNVEDCYKTLGIFHSKFPTIPGRFKDYISTPKPNGYASLHTTIIGPLGRPIELQIRTKEMNEIARFGIAAHWTYKYSNKKTKMIDKKGSRWIADVLDIIQNAGGPQELIEHTKIDMYSENVFCFTPKGDVISLVRGSSPIDFAYAVHSGIGNKAVGSKVNGKIAPLNYKLRNGDQVEILRSDGQSPQSVWLNYTCTGKARSQIRKFIREHEKDEFEKMGKAILEKRFKDINRPFNKVAINLLLRSLSYVNFRSLCVAIGRGEISAEKITNSIFPNLKCEKTKSLNNAKKNINSIAIKGLKPGIAMHIADCCFPLPGERIAGIMTEGHGVTVHSIDCATLERFSEFPDRWLELMWSKDEEKIMQIGRLNTILVNKTGALNSITSSIARSNSNIVNFQIIKRSQDFFEMLIDVQVSDIRHLNNIIAALTIEPDIYKVERKKI